MPESIVTTGNGLFLSSQDFLSIEITVQDYINRLIVYLDIMVNHGAFDEETAHDWADYAIRTLGYSSREEYVEKIGRDTRIINPAEGRLIFKAGEIPTTGKHGDFIHELWRGAFGQTLNPEEWRGWKSPWETVPEYTMAMPEGFSAGQLPLFKQVVAPMVYRNEAQRLGRLFGYLDDEGNIVGKKKDGTFQKNESGYNTLLKNASKDAESYQLLKVNELLTFNLQQAEISKDNAKIKLANENLQKAIVYRNENLQKAQDFTITELGKQQAIELEAFKKQERAEAWQKQTEQFGLGGEPARTPPSAEPIVQEFLEEDRPGGIQRFIESQLPSALQQFQREQGGARQAWWRAINRPSHETAVAQAERDERRWLRIRGAGLREGWQGELQSLEAGLNRPLTSQDVTPDQWAFWIGTSKWQAAQAKKQKLQGLAPEQIEAYDTDRDKEDPLKSYLTEYPWQAEFFKLSPSQRGFSPSRFAPSARWFV